MNQLLERVSALEAEKALYRQALDTTRKDFQDFAHSVSHDLRAPLRAIEGFSHILMDDFSADLNPEAQRFLKHIINSASQLSGLIEDLLLFSRAGKEPPRKGPLNPAPLVAEVYEEQKALHPETQTKLVLGDLPEMMADQNLIRQAFGQLISNALKATSGIASGVVTVSGRTEDGARIYVVEDNGIGFNLGTDAKLFQVFQKLHPPQQFSGNGIGLALVKRIITAHGGCIRAHGEVGKGARFSMTLPYQPPVPGAKTGSASS